MISQVYSHIVQTPEFDAFWGMKDPHNSVVAISQFVVSWISLTNFANFENSAGSTAQSIQLLK